MDFTGLVTNLYKKNRKITADERQNRLFQKDRAEVDALYELSVIKINSTYLETVDRFFDARGAVTLFSAILLGVSLWMVGSLAYVMLETYGSGMYDGFTAIGVFAFVLALNLPLIVFVFWAAGRELFRLTHYPIRLNRRNRMLYIFKLDSSIISVPWDDVFFTLGKCSSMYGKTWDIRGLVLNDDRETVKDEFAFSLHSTDKGILRKHWEFLRRYMEEGPRELVRQVEFCMPVDGKRESFRSGLERIFAIYFGSGIFFWLMLPFNVAVACSRWVVMRTCRIPVWSDEIEDACRIEGGDPYVRDSSINPPNLR